MGCRFGAHFGAVVLALTWLAAAAASANAAGLKCECVNCTYKNGRTEVPYNFDTNFNSTSAGRAQYDAAERTAMNEADQAAVSAIAAAMAAPPSCPDPCDPQAAWDSSHGPPFAGGTGGSGIARSLWKATYSCFKKVVVPPPPAPAPPPNGGVNVLPGVSPQPTNPPKPTATTTCPECQRWLDLLKTIDHNISQLWEQYPLYTQAGGKKGDEFQILMQWAQTQRAEVSAKLRDCELNYCVRPVQDMTPPAQYTMPPQNTQPPAQNTMPPLGFGFGGFGFGGEESNRGRDFNRGGSDHGR